MKQNTIPQTIDEIKQGLPYTITILYRSSKYLVNSGYQYLYCDKWGNFQDHNSVCASLFPYFAPSTNVNSSAYTAKLGTASRKTCPDSRIMRSFPFCVQTFVTLFRIYIARIKKIHISAICSYEMKTLSKGCLLCRRLSQFEPSIFRDKNQQEIILIIFHETNM